MTHPNAAHEPDLLRRARDGDERAFSALVDLHRPRVEAVAWRLTRDPRLAGEVAQDAFVRMHAALPAFREDASVSTWLYRIVVNLCHDRARRTARDRSMSLDEAIAMPSPDHQPDATAEAAERARVLDSMVQSLPAPMREAVVLRYAGGLAYDEIAATLGWSARYSGIADSSCPARHRAHARDAGHPGGFPATHDEAQALWLLSDDGALDAARQEALREHLAQCAACRAEVDTLAATDSALRAWGAAGVPNPGAPVSPIAAGTVRPWIPVAIAAAVAGITLGSAGGYLAGVRAIEPAPETTVATTPPDTRSSFVLLLEPAAQWPPASALARPGYFEWMDSLTARGQYEDGLRLSEDEGWYIARSGGAAVPAGARTASAANFSGMFVIRARDYDEAVAIARESPHLRYGGVLVRRTY